MDRSRGIIALALALYALSLLEYDGAFVNAVRGQARPAMLRGGIADVSAEGIALSSGPAPVLLGWANSGLQVTAALLVLGAVGSKMRGVAAYRQAGGSRACAVQLRAQNPETGSGLFSGGAVLIYSKALASAAAQKGESVKVTKDVIKIKNTFFNDDEFTEIMVTIKNDFTLSLMEKSDKMIQLLGPFESTVVPKFITFLAKKKRLQSVYLISKEYVDTLYDEQSVAPVIVKTSARLTPGQMDAIKEKMKAKTGCEAIKLVEQVDASLLGGFILQWGFTDPESLVGPTKEQDLSLVNVLRQVSIAQGVIMKQ